MSLHPRWRGKKKLVLRLDRTLIRYLKDLRLFGDSPAEVAIYLIRSGIIDATGKGGMARTRDFSKRDAPVREHLP